MKETLTKFSLAKAETSQVIKLNTPFYVAISARYPSQ